MILKTSASLSLKTLAVLLCLPASLFAQRSDVFGHVVLVAGADSVPVSAATVTLHRITLDGGAPIDSTVSNRNGVFRFRNVEFDSLALFVASTEYAGIAYFTSSVAPRADSSLAEPLAVYDTSSVAPSIVVAQRHVIVSPTENGENVGVLEMLVLENSGAATRVSADSVVPVWTGRIPPEALQFRVGQSEVSGEAITLVGNQVGVVAPLPPGRRQIVYSYNLPRGIEEVDFSLDQPVGDMNFLVDVRSEGRVSGDLTSLGEQEVGNATYLHYEGANLAAGLDLQLVFAGPPFTPGDLVPWIAALGALAMVFVGLVAWRRTPATALATHSPGPGPRGVDVGLAARIAALDRQFETLESPTDEQAESYQKQRAEMKEILLRALANEDSAG